MPPPLQDSVALVTGASRGIGRAVACALAALGAHCVLTARSPGGLEETDDLVRTAGGAGCTLLPLDLEDGAALDGIGPSLASRFGRLDILVHAAATLGALTPVPHATDRDFARSLAVNATASWRLIRTTSPLLLASPAGRAVFLTDAHARSPVAYWGLLGAGKAAMENLVLSWADEVASHRRLRVNLFDPGAVATRLRAQAMPGEDASGLPRPEAVADAVVALCLPGSARHADLVTPATTSTHPDRPTRA
ncbi:SDR family NAD(P)-dependent oxidoreductase [Lichenicoccus roseus]|uniref:SDR family NAD(P)-dependent oxidoreductase n=1 Tax=Lichenicoccus roseus TaxID=2683649 RepID=A0A5R9J991_9PROT|nr:SDR family NAD(P)-dependent oxidoreductase [Lichenicoccus roseus]TLU73373.1 SDR family NAD(P)-dependent oxidoreductase [Lichenicoccus roseus]